MSLPAPLPAAPAAFTTAVCCPACGDHLRAHPHEESALFTFPCGHTACRACVDAVLLCAAPVCPVCLVLVAGAAPNIALGVFAECAHGGVDLGDALSGSGADNPLLLSLPCLRSVASSSSQSSSPAPSSTLDPAPAGGKKRAAGVSMPAGAAPRKNSGAKVASFPALASESSVAHGNPTPVELVDVLTAYDNAAECMLRGVPALTVAKERMLTRKDASVVQFSGAVDEVVTALRRHQAAVVHAVNAACDERVKVLDNQVEVLIVSASQLRSAVAIGRAALATNSLAAALSARGYVDALSPLVKLSLVPAVVPVVVLHTAGDLRVALDSLRSCAARDNVMVVSASFVRIANCKPSLFAPLQGAANELVLNLAHNDGSVPVWLADEDVAVTMTCVSARTSGASSGAVVASAASVRSAGEVHVQYGDVAGRTPAAADIFELCVKVCSVSIGSVRVQRPALAGHRCGAFGTFFRSLKVSGAGTGMAVSPSEEWLVVANSYVDTVSVRALPGGKRVRTFDTSGTGYSHSSCPSRLCFAPNGNIIVTLTCGRISNQRLLEVTLAGVHVRTIGLGDFSNRQPNCVAVRDDVIAVGCCGGTGPRVVLFDFRTGAVARRFGEVGPEPGELSESCSGIQFTPDSSHIVVAESGACRLSLFTKAGVFVKCIGVGVLGRGPMDVLFTAASEYVVADCHNGRVCVFSPDGSELVRSWVAHESAARPNHHSAAATMNTQPVTLAAAGKHLYVLFSPHRPTVAVQVFE